MIPDLLTLEDRAALLKLARMALEEGVLGKLLEPLDMEAQPPCLQQTGATFVTLKHKGELRGCIGALDAYQSLAEDVREHAIAAALQDYRFRPVQPEEISEITIEISRLAPPKPLEYEHPEDLPRLLRPCIDGVILRDGTRRATFLPQVWEKVADPELFLSYLCQKMGALPDAWRRKKMDVWTYQVEEFHE